jgi:hypothetical protein
MSQILKSSHTQMARSATPLTFSASSLISRATVCIASIAHGVSQFLNSCRNALQPKPRQIFKESNTLNRIRRKRDELGGLLERGVGVSETLEGVGVDGAEQRDEEVSEVREAVAGEAREVGEGGEGVGEKGGTGRGDCEEGGERSAVRRGDSVDHAGEVVADAAVRLAHAQVRCHLRRRRWGFGFQNSAAAAGRSRVSGSIQTWRRSSHNCPKRGADQQPSPSIEKSTVMIEFCLATRNQNKFSLKEISNILPLITYTNCN